MSTNPHIDQYIMESEDEHERKMNEAREEIEGLRGQRDALAVACAAMLANCVWPLGQSKGERFGQACDMARKAIADAGLCPKCGGEMQSQSKLGYDRHGQEQEADWDECLKCGHTI